MEIRIKFEPEINDLAMIVALVDQLATLAGMTAPKAAKQLRKQIGYRLKRLNTVKRVD
jgi:hypothetical protein